MGDQSGASNLATQNLDFAGWLRTYDKVLATYNAGSPYVTLNVLKAQMNNKYALFNNFTQIARLLKKWRDAFVAYSNDYDVVTIVERMSDRNDIFITDREHVLLRIVLEKGLEAIFNSGFSSMEVINWIHETYKGLEPSYDRYNISDEQRKELKDRFLTCKDITGVQNRHLETLKESINVSALVSLERYLIKSAKFLDTLKEYEETKNGKEQTTETEIPEIPVENIVSNQAEASTLTI